jgi:hypothetical protein
MKHIEVHVIESRKDLELAQLAGLLDDALVRDTICDSCEKLIPSNKSAKMSKPLAFVTVSETSSKLSCEVCLTNTITGLILK